MGKVVLVENKPLNLNKKVKMMKRRLQKQQLVIRSLEERNIELSTELNKTKITLSHMSDEYNKLIARNYENNFQFNHKQEELIKMKAFTGNEIMSALKITGNLSEVLLNLKKFLSVESTSVDTRVGSPMIPSSPSLHNRTEIFLPSSSEAKRVQAAVSPMIKGIALKQPTISLRRLNPDEILAFRGESPCRKEESNACPMTPIQEEPSTPPLPSEPIRSRLGSRNQVPPLTVREESIIRDFIPEAQSEPVVRLSDVSRLLSNTSWVNINYSASSPRTNEPKIDDLLTNIDNAPSSSSDNCPDEIPVNSLGTITVRKRKNVLISPCKNHEDTLGNKLETEMQLAASEVQISPSTSSSFVENEQINEVKNLLRVSNITKLSDIEERKSIGSISTDKGIVTESTFVIECNTSITNQGPQSFDEDVAQQPSTSTLMENTNIDEGKYCRPKSIRVKRPSVRYLNTGLVLSKSPNESVKKKKSTSLSVKSSSISVDSVNASSSNVVNISQERRTSSRSKKTIKYLDEPFSSKEMSRILKKGRKKH